MSKELEALETLKRMEWVLNNGAEKSKNLSALHTIEQALKEKEKQDELLKIIKVNKVYIQYITSCSNYLEYNDRVKYRFSGYEDMLLEEEEFNLIKEWLNE